jgi:hypothetical protein
VLWNRDATGAAGLYAYGIEASNAMLHAAEMGYRMDTIVNIALESAYHSMFVQSELLVAVLFLITCQTRYDRQSR